MTTGRSRNSNKLLYLMDCDKE